MKKGSNLKFKAFTFIELIIVITILAILGTIGFVSYNGYIGDSRDSSRLSQIASIYSALDGYRIKGYLPLPENKVSISASGELIGYLGVVGEDILNKIGQTEGGKDPDDNKYFTYYIDNKQRNIEMLAYLENDEKLNGFNIFSKANAFDYSQMLPKPYGDKMGILLNSDNSPVNENPGLVSAGIDVVTTNEKYKAVFSEKDNITGSGIILQVVYGTTRTGIIGKSCQDYIDANEGYFLNPGNYLINSSGLLSQTYCVMN